jgi:hypothetical protein
MADGGNLAVSPHSSDIVFCVGHVYNAAYFLAVSHTSDGTTFEHDTLALGAHGYAVAFDPVDPNRVYVGGDSGSSQPCLLVTTDCGASWTQNRSGLAGVVWTIAVAPTDPQRVYAGTNNGVFRSTNAGATWVTTGLTQPTRVLVIDPNHPETLFAGTSGQGVYCSTDGGVTWATMNEGLTNPRILSMSIRPGIENVLFVGTDGSAVFRTSVSTALASASSLGLGTARLLISPNPCREFATIRLNGSLLVSDPVLLLYDASGRLLAAFPVNAASFSLPTSDLAPGTYFVRLNATGRTGMCRFTVLD